MYKLLIIAAIAVSCLAAPLESTTELASSTPVAVAASSYPNPPAPIPPKGSSEESSEESKETSGPHKRESPVIPPVQPVPVSTENPESTRPKQVAVPLPAHIPHPVAVS